MKRKPSVLLVPSCDISPHNVLTPGNTLARCRHALMLWRAEPFDYILVTGGIFNPPDVQSVPAGELMAEWFEQHQVPRAKIVVEGTSLDTFENIHHGLGRLKVRGIEDADFTVVTQWQHTWRFWITMRWVYGLQIKRIGLKYPMSLKSSVMEYFFIAYNAWDPHGTGFLAQKNRRDRRALVEGNK